MYRPAGSGDVHQKNAKQVVGQTFILIEQLDVVEISRMLTI